MAGLVLREGEGIMIRKCKCACCGIEFETERNAKKYCSVKCRAKFNKKQARIKMKTCTCNWCGIVFETEKKRKYCSEDCRMIANRRKKNKALKHNKSIEQIAKLAREAGLSYGQYVQKMGL